MANRDDDDNGDPSGEYSISWLDNDSTAPEPRSIANICYEVLERIFEFLDVGSLLNVANTCKRLQIAAAAKFHDDFRNKQIHFEITSVMHGISYSESEVCVRGLKYCLPFLRCFGGKCLNLKIHLNCDTPAAQRDHLDQYINRYCADTLTSIRFVQETSFKFMENSPKPFKNVKNVLIGHLDLGQNLPLIAKVFPNLSHLHIYSILIDKNFTAVSFPHLKDLGIIDCRNITTNGVRKLLQANRQLSGFRLGLIFNPEPLTLSELLNMIAENPYITKICAPSGHKIFVNTNELQRFVNERAEMIALDLTWYIIEVEDAVKFILQMRSLKNFKFKLKGLSEYNRLVNQLSNEWKYSIIFLEYNPSYPLNNVVTLNR